MKVRVLTMLCFTTAIWCAAGLGRHAGADEATPERFVLYSIDGTDYAPGKAPKADETIAGYPVMGKVEIKDAAKRQEIVTALKDGIAQSDGNVAKCFWPRHAIELVEKGKITV